MSRKKFWLTVLSTLLLSAFIVGTGVAWCDSGQGSCGFVRMFPVLFPFAVLSGAAENDDPGLFILLAVIQYPLYAVIVRAVSSRFTAAIPATFLFVAHALMTLLAFLSWRF